MNMVAFFIELPVTSSTIEYRDDESIKLTTICPLKKINTKQSVEERLSELSDPFLSVLGISVVIYLVQRLIQLERYFSTSYRNKMSLQTLSRRPYPKKFLISENAFTTYASLSTI